MQALEYVDDVDRALAELARVVRPGGRVVIWDVDWTTVSWHSADADRMRRVLAVWDGHLAHPALPRTLAGRLRRAGFQDVRVAGHVFVSEDDSADTYGGALVPIVEDYVRGNSGIGVDEASAWAAEQRDLSRRGEFFFACVQLCFAATRGD